MRNQTLLERQVDLLRYLTRNDFIFDDEWAGSASQDPSLQGMNISHLRLEAEMSFGKRIAKIGQVLKYTFVYLGPQRRRLFREFALQHPPITFRRYAEARCFYDFLLRHWQSTPPTPPFIADVARLEIAQARVRAFRYGEEPSRAEIPPALEAERPLVRLHPGVELVHMDYDLRGLFERDGVGQFPPRRPHHLLVTQMRRGIAARVMEVTEAVSDLLEDLREWRSLERVLGGIPPEQSDSRDALRRFLQATVVELAE